MSDLGNYLPSTAMIALVSMNLEIVGTEFVLKRINNWLENLLSNVCKHLVFLFKPCKQARIMARYETNVVLTKAGDNDLAK